MLKLLGRVSSLPGYVGMSYFNVPTWDLSLTRNVATSWINHYSHIIFMLGFKPFINETRTHIWAFFRESYMILLAVPAKLPFTAKS